jgi:hypothetical protein
MRTGLLWLGAALALACGGSDRAEPRGATAAPGAAAGAPTEAPGEDEPVSAGCGELRVERAPFGCELAWGTNGDRDERAEYLDFITTWVGYEARGGLDSSACDGCRLAQSLSSRPAMAVYYAYFIGYQASAAGYGDCNTDFDGQNLCTHGAAWLRANREHVVDMYASYADKTFAVSPDKPVAWLLEGDFVQYTYDEQSEPFSMAELGALAQDIVCAIKAGQPNALVAINHSAWLSDGVTQRFWDAMPQAGLDFLWTTGVGDNAGFLNPDADAASYNADSARYAYLSQLTGLGILVDTSFGASQAADSWSGVPHSELDARIGEGVIAVNVTEPPSDFQSRLEDREGLASTCR